MNKSLQPSEPDSLAEYDGWIGPFVNFYCPGLSQLFFKETRRRGLILLLLSISALSGFVIYLSSLIFNPEPSWSWRNVFPLILLLFVMFFLWLMSLVDAYRVLSHFFTKRQDRNRKSMGFGLFLTLVFPSLGHWYLRRITKGILFVYLFICLSLLEDAIAKIVSNWQYLILIFIVSIAWAMFYYWMCVDLASSNDSLSPCELPKHQLIFLSKKKTILLVTFFIYFLNFPYPELSSRYLVSIAKIASPSMQPSFNKDDWVFVRKLSNPESRLKRNDVVVFKLQGRKEEMAKRILGLPGDYLSFLKEGVILVNGEPYLRKFEVSTWPESFEKKELVVPSGHVFVIGDNPQYSLDSFQFGSVPIESVAGHVLKVFFPFRTKD